MYLIYIDDSGDPGRVNSPTTHMLLTAIVFHEYRWGHLLDELVRFRQSLKVTKGLKLREEIHAVNFINKPGSLSRIRRNDRLDILKKCIDWVAVQQDISVITVSVNKTTLSPSLDVYETAWKRLIQRLDNTLSHKNFPHPNHPEDIDCGIIFSDDTNGGQLTKILRKMRRYNAVPNNSNHQEGYRDIQVRYIVDDPVMRDSGHNYFIQMADVIAYFARQHYEPNSYIRKKGAKTFYGRLGSRINPHVTRYRTNFGIVEA